MSKEQAGAFLNNYKTDRALMEKVESLFEANPEKPDGELWAQAGKEAGFEFTPQELDEVFHERIQNEDVSVQTLDEKELAAVAGGDKKCVGAFWCTLANKFSEENKHDNCKDTFVNRENCWHNDGCDNCYNMYSDYQCNHSGECDWAFTHR